MFMHLAPAFAASRGTARRGVLATISVFGLLFGNVSAQVEYVRELVGTENIGTSTATAVLTATQSHPGQAGQMIVTAKGYFGVNGANGAVADVERIPQAVYNRLSDISVVALAGQGSPYTPAALVGSQAEIFTIKADGDLGVAPAPFIQLSFNAASSLAWAAQSATSVSLIVDGEHYMVNTTTGAATATTVMSGLNSASTRFQSYAPDGNLYVLDYGNSRMASFDPTNAFAQVGSFNLNTAPGIITANVQFAIGLNGSFYLADGLGGGTYYNSAGTYQGAFFTPEGTVGDSYIGASYVSTDSSGRVYVYDSATGFHQFQDLAISSIPEPSTYAFGIASLLGGLIVLRRRAAV